MAIFTSGELADIRSDLNSLLPGTCNILSLTRTKTSTGGGTITWGTATAGVACDIWRGRQLPLERGVSEGHDELVARADFTFAMPYNTTIDEDNRVEYGGEQFQVIGVDNTLPDQLQLRVMVQRSESNG